MTSQHPIIRRAAAGRFAPHLLIQALLMAALLAGAPGVHAQDAKSPAQLRRENDALREQIREVEAALKRNQEEIQRLNLEIADLREQLESQPLDDFTFINATSGPVPDDRFACPDALRQWLIDDFARAFTNIEVPAEQPLRHWVRRAKLERSTVLWDVRVLGWDQENPDAVEVIAFDWQSGENRCHQFTIALAERDADRLRSSPEQVEWTIEGVFAAAPAILDDDDVPGDFELIDVAVRFDWTMTVRSLEPFQEDNPERSIAR